MYKLNFVPDRDGWHFSNQFETRILPGVLSGVRTRGLCGGMIMTALDYWRAGVPIPTHEPDDFPPDANGNRLPDEASLLRRYIFDRQMNSLLTRLMFTRWIVAPGIRPVDFHNWAVNSEFEVIKGQLGLNRPTMLGLWSMTPGNPTGGHQVLCYGWDTAPNRLYVYDPNNPDEETILTPLSPEQGVCLKGVTSGRETFYRGYFFTDVYNWAEYPAYRPRYRDLVLSTGLSTNPGGPDINVGTPLSLSTTVQNIGEYRSRFRSFVIWARDPMNANIDNRVGGIEPGFTSLNPGTSRLISRNVPPIGTAPGNYTIGVAKESAKGHWQDIPGINTTTLNRKQLRLWPVKREIANTSINVSEASRDVDTGLVLQPGDDYALTGTGSIWAGVWFTGVNGPEGWTDRIETNADFPLNNTPDSRPFSLVGKFEGEGFFYIGSSIPRRRFTSSTPRRLFLRINDNIASNGSGAFQCQVQVWR